MFRRSFNRIGQISAAVLAAAWLTTAAAPCRAQTGILAGQYMGAEEAEQAILATLDRRISVNFNERPLKEARATLQNALGVPIVLDEKGLAEASIPLDTPITFAVPSISARTALGTMLSAKDLSWLIDGDLLFITTSEKERTMVVTRVYPVAALVFTESGDAYEADFDSLIDAITSTIAPSAWDSAGGAGGIEPFAYSGALIISQTREVHEQIESLLARLREVRDIQGLPAAFRIVHPEVQADQGGAFTVENTAADAAPTPARPAAPQPAPAQPQWRIPRVYR